MEKATTLEESVSPPPGPPPLIKPSHELFGEILLRTSHPKEAAKQFARSLLRQQDRAHSLIGAARATARSGDREGAASLYSEFLSQWQPADAPRPELREAQDYLKQTGVRPSSHRG
jgi:hypothetical protein